MNIIKTGSPPHETWCRTHTCKHCQCEFELDWRDESTLKTWNYPDMCDYPGESEYGILAFGRYSYFPCPTCRVPVLVHARRINEVIMVPLSKDCNPNA